MNTRIIFSVLAAIFVDSAAHAQHTPYAGQEKREIKALSAEEMKQHLAGAGMGYARAAELNNYPGPMHVLELVDKLGLTSEQRTATEKLMNEHKAEARAIGTRLVEAERVLDHLFANGKASEAELAQQVRTVASLQGDYRLSHLETHRRLRPLLTDEQVKRYAHLRGYAGGNPSPGQHKH